MRVIGISGSPRRGGNTDQSLQIVLDSLKKEGIDGELFPVGGLPVRGCLACGWCMSNQVNRCVQTEDYMNALIEKMMAADGILLASPVYYADITPEIKAVIDRAGFVTRSNGSTLARKVGAGIAIARRAGAIHAFDSLNHFFLINEMVIPGSSYWNVGYGLSKGDIQEDAEGVETLRTLGENMAWLLKKLKG
ncbi:MAG: flavodoxin family protein [Synergistaceae bacterium]|nr:flavodoxin family protein [Synergistaceae bacterium]MBP9626823.1 flavodoxin family protein [Synergistaceae bacterium]MBP9958411.1 flavodoxin family protein [Synergistaceae bacterium]